MRLATLVLLAVAGCQAQFKSTVPLVVAPTTVTDSKGRFADGLEAGDLILYDNNVRQPIQLDFEVYPISLVVAIQSSANSQAVLDKLGRSGNLLAQLVAGEAGETAVITFSDEVHLRQDFTDDPDALTRVLRHLQVEGGGAVSLSAVMGALRMLEKRPPGRRRIILTIAEKRDRSSKVKLEEVVAEAQRQNALIYWVTYSPSLTSFTARPKTVKSDDPKENGEPIPYDAGPMNLLAIFPELFQLGKPDVAELFSKATGARTMGFLKRNGLEQAIEAVGAEVHRQYILTFKPGGETNGRFHPIRVAVKGRPDLEARTRAGYWPLE